MKHGRFVCIAAFLFAILSALPNARAQGYSSQGDLYYLDGSIYRMAQDGSAVLFDSGRYAYLACDLSGNLYAASDAGDSSYSIYKFTPDGTISTFATGIAPGAQLFGGLKSDRFGHLYGAVNDGSSFSVFQFSATGVQTTFLQGTGNVSWFAFDGSDNLFVRSGSSILKYNSKGEQSVFATDVSASILTMDALGNLYLSGSNGFIRNTIFMISPDGTKSTLASGLNGGVYGLACDLSGNLYAGQTGFLTQITPDGTATTIETEMKKPNNMVFLVPEPSTWALLVAGYVGAFIAAGRLHRGTERPSRLSNVGLSTPGLLARKSQEAELITSR